MEKHHRQPCSDANAAVNRTRSIYANWAKKNGIPYYELLVLHLLYEAAPCTQKQISEMCGLPKQTVHRIVSALAEAGHLAIWKTESNKKEKNLRLTEDGIAYAEDLLTPLRQIERIAIRQMGAEQYQLLLSLMLHYQQSLEVAILTVKYSEEGI